MTAREEFVSADVVESMRDEEQSILELANELGKFAIQVGPIPAAKQLALERLQLSGRVRLIDVSSIAEYPGVLFRIFLVSNS